MITKQSITLFFKEKYVFRFTVLAGVFILFGFLWTGLFLRSSGSLNPIHYSIFFGVDRIGPWYALLKYPSAAALVTAINFFIGYLIFYRDKYLTYYLLLMGMLCAGMTALYLVFLRSYAY